MKCLVGIVLFAVIWILPSQAQDLTELMAKPGGSRIFSEGSSYYGNNVTLRGGLLPSGAQKSWIDFETMLPAGVLSKYLIYVPSITGSTNGDTSTRIMLQIWRPVDIVNYVYQLAWSRAVTVRFDSPTGILYSYGVPDKFDVVAGDRLGWTNEDDFSAISFQYIEGHRTYFRTFASNQYPTVKNEYTFDSIAFPAIFSVAVEINPEGLQKTTLVPDFTTEDQGSAPAETIVFHRMLLAVAVVTSVGICYF